MSLNGKSLNQFEIVTESAGQTKRLAAALAVHLTASDVIALTGDLGAGKTTFTQGLAAGLGIKEPIVSPTFTILRVYAGRLPLYHFDLYRLEKMTELETIGCEEYFFDSGVSVIEWGDKAAALLPDDYLTIEIHHAIGRDDVRLLKVLARGRRSAELILRIKDEARNLKLRVVDRTS